MLTSVRGMGLAVAPGADKRCRSDRVKLVQARLDEVLFEARQSGLDGAEVRQMIEDSLLSLDKKVAARKK